MQEILMRGCGRYKRTDLTESDISVMYIDFYVDGGHFICIVLIYMKYFLVNVVQILTLNISYNK